ncbi:hypothetical protein pipiens_003457 [Culex pipiens pipiens]|uniref:Alkaline phosphatase n=1 Tax=Culex pipiens pipiens TaxID=38569 RepID=A0ABD1CXM2_CULPP
MALGRRFGPTLAISLVLFCAAGLTGGHEEHDPNYWNHQAHELLFEKKDYTMQKINIAKNIMVFVGAGMSPATVTAARTFAGAENETFAFEKMKWSGNARTYCVDSRVPDSACAGTAFLTGVKSNLGTVAMHPTVKRGDCVATSDKVKQLESIAKWALDAGKVVGFATTSRVTAGSSAALYGHSADARWENDADVTAAGCNPAEVRDIAYQLIHGEVGKRFTVIFGGGRKNFIPSTATDASGARGLRADGKNLIEEWKQSKTTGNAVYITTGVKPLVNRYASRRKSVFAETYDPENDDDDDGARAIFPKTDEQRSRLCDSVKNILLFRSLDKEQMNEVLDAMFEKIVKSKDYIIKQGDDGDNFYVIESGIYKAYVGEDQKHIHTYEGRGSFGELALLYNMPRAATIQAETDGQLWAMDRQTFRRILLKSAFRKRKMYEALLDSVPMLKTLQNYERMNLADALIPRTFTQGERIIKQVPPGGRIGMVPGSVLRSEQLHFQVLLPRWPGMCAWRQLHTFRATVTCRMDCVDALARSERVVGWERSTGRRIRYGSGMVINNKHDNEMGKYGAILTQGIIDAVTVNFLTVQHFTQICCCPLPTHPTLLQEEECKELARSSSLSCILQHIPVSRRENGQRSRRRFQDTYRRRFRRQSKQVKARRKPKEEKNYKSKDATPAPPTNSIDRCHRRPRMGPNSASTFRTPVVHNPARLMRVQVKLISKDVTISENVIMQHNAAAGVQVLV